MILFIMSMMTAELSAAEPVNEFSLEFGTIAGRNESWLTVADYSSPTFGVQYAHGINSWLSLSGSWHMGSVTSSVELGYDDYYYDDSEYEDDYYEYSESYNEISSRFYHNQFLVGPKFGWQAKSWLRPYASTQALILHSRLQLSDNLEEPDDAIVHISDHAFGFGGLLGGGVELKTRKSFNNMRISTHFEGGYSIATSMNYSATISEDADEKVDVGTMSVGGGYFKAGIGLRF